MKNRVDLVHVGDLYPQGVIGLCLKSWLGIPYIAYCHGEDIELTDRRRYQPLVRNRIYQEAAVVVANSEFAVRNLIRIGIPKDRIQKINPGVDCNRFRPRPKDAEIVERFALHGKPVLLTVARLTRRKGHDIVLKALSKIRSSLPPLCYLIVGTGEEEQRLRSLTQELGLQDIVRFVGYVPDDHLPSYYATCDMFILLNRQEEDGDIEGFGMVFLEANASGKAVIGGQSGGAGDAVEDGRTGILIDPTDIASAASTIQSMLSDPVRCESMGHAGRLRAQEKFSWKSKALMLRQISKDVVQRVRRRN